jgi:hypothetical protein
MLNKYLLIVVFFIHALVSAISIAEATNAEGSALLLARLAALQNQPLLQAPVVPVPQNNLPTQAQTQTMSEILLARLAAQQAQNPAPVPVVRVAERERLEAERIAQAERERIRIAQAAERERLHAQAVRLSEAIRLSRAERERVEAERIAQVGREEADLYPHLVQPAPQPGITGRGQIDMKLAEWKTFYTPYKGTWQQKGDKSAAALKSALFGCYANARQKQLNSVEQWHTNFSLLLRDPHMKNWVLPSYNGPSMAVEAVGWYQKVVHGEHINGYEDYSTPSTNTLWLKVQKDMQLLVGEQKNVKQWFHLLDSSKDSNVDNTRGSLRGRVKIIVDFLQETKNSREQIDKSFFEKAVETLQDGQTACADRTVVSLDNLELAAALHRTSKQNPASKVHTLLSVGLVQFKLALIEQDFIKREAEALQAALYYRINLADSLNLGINTKGSRYGHQFLDKVSLEQAIDETFKAATPIALAEFLAKWDPWKEHMAPTYEAESDAVLEQYGNLYGGGRVDEANELLANFEVTKLTKNTAAALDALKDPANGGYLTQNRHYAIPRELIDN